MKKLMCVLAFATLILSYSCDDDDNKAPTVKSATEYYPLKEGNYWIYDIYFEKIDYNNDNTFRKANYQDTVTVTGTELIDGKRYYTLSEKSPANWRQFQTRITADSAGYLMNQNKNRFFSNVNFTDSIIKSYQTRSGEINSDTVFYIKGIMEKINTPYTCAAGKFSDILNMYRVVYLWNRPLKEDAPFLNPRDVNTYYAKNVGVVYHTASWEYDSQKIEWRLAKYCIDGVVYPKE